MSRLYFVFFLSFFCCFCKPVFAQQWNRVGTEVISTPGDPLGPYIETMYVWKEKLYAAGAFLKIGDRNAPGIISWNGTTWDTLAEGLGFSQSIYSYDENLIAGGVFQYAGNQLPHTDKIAAWDGEQWLSLSTDNPSSYVWSLLEYKNKLYVGGWFQFVGQQTVNKIASWDGLQWQGLDGGFTNGLGCYAMAVYNDKLITGGDFTRAGNVTAFSIAAWDGNDWTDLDTGLAGLVKVLVTDTVNNILYAGGSFGYAGGNGGIAVDWIAQWNGTEWNTVGGNWVKGDVLSMCMYHGELFVGRYSITDSQQDTLLMKWNGWEWQKIPGLDGNVHSLTVYNDELYVAGNFWSCGSDSCRAIARYYAPPDTTLAANKPLIKQTAWLYDNCPNPSPGLTQIPYYLPDGKTGQLVIHDLQGKEISRYNLKPGKNYLEVNTTLWDPGLYINTMVWDGWKKQSKRMVITRP